MENGAEHILSQNVLVPYNHEVLLVWYHINDMV